MNLLRSSLVAFLLGLVACGPSEPTRSAGSSASSGNGSAEPLRSTTSAKPARPGSFEACSGSNDKWVGFASYPGATMLCCQTTNGLPHIFSTVFASDDDPARVKDFYREKKGDKTKLENEGARLSVTRDEENHPFLSVDPIAALPPGCPPGSATKTLITISDSPPFPH